MPIILLSKLPKYVIIRNKMDMKKIGSEFIYNVLINIDRNSGMAVFEEHIEIVDDYRPPEEEDNCLKL